MVNYSKVSAEDCENLECLAEAFNLFALFDTPANVIFVDQFISNITILKIFLRDIFHVKISFFHANVTKALLF